MISLNSISILSLGLGLNLKSYMNLLLIWGPIYPQNIILPLKKGHRGLSFEGMRPSFRRDSSCCSRTERHNCLLIFTGYSPRDGKEEYIPSLLNWDEQMGSRTIGWEEGSNSTAPLKSRQPPTSHWDQSIDSRLKFHSHLFSTRMVPYIHRVIWFENCSEWLPKTSWKPMSECLKGVLGDET